MWTWSSGWHHNQDRTTILCRSHPTGLTILAAGQRFLYPYPWVLDVDVTGPWVKATCYCCFWRWEHDCHSPGWQMQLHYPNHSVTTSWMWSHACGAHVSNTRIWNTVGFALSGRGSLLPTNCRHRSVGWAIREITCFNLLNYEYLLS